MDKLTSRQSDPCYLLLYLAKLRRKKPLSKFVQSHHFFENGINGFNDALIQQPSWYCLIFGLQDWGINFFFAFALTDCYFPWF